jgi:crotonobetainyl-CoA:carnitine CoA-transferase CaiB-like acyl-CoA transferase
MEALFADVSADEVCENLDAFGVPVARVNSLDEVHDDPQVRHSGSLVETRHPVIGPMRYPRPPFHFEGQETFPARHAPFLGDHTREILAELATDEVEIERLEKRDAANREVLRSLQG